MANEQNWLDNQEIIVDNLIVKCSNHKTSMSPYSCVLAERPVVRAPERSSKGFLHSDVLSASGEAMHNVPVAGKNRGALTDKPARELVSGISRTGQTW